MAEESDNIIQENGRRNGEPITIQAGLSGIGFQIRTKESYLKEGSLVRDFEVLCNTAEIPVTKNMVKIGDVCSIEDDFAFLPAGELRQSRGMALFYGKILKILEGEKVLEGVKESQVFACHTLCETMAGIGDGSSNGKAVSEPSQLTEEALLAFSYGKKPDAMCGDMKGVFEKLQLIESKGEIEELRLLSIYLKLVIKKKDETKSKMRGEARRVFNQHMDNKGFISWYLREKGPDGKLLPTRYFGKSLPNNIDIALDRVNFHPQFVATSYGILPGSPGALTPPSLPGVDSVEKPTAAPEPETESVTEEAPVGTAAAAAGG